MCDIGSAYDHFCAPCPECCGECYEVHVQGDRSNPVSITYECPDCSLTFKEYSSDAAAPGKDGAYI